MDAAPDANGTIAVANTRSSHNNQIAYMHHCLQIGPQGKKDGSVGLAACLPEGSPDEAPSKPSQKWEVTVNADQTITIKQGSLCVTTTSCRAAAELGLGQVRGNEVHK